MFLRSPPASEELFCALYCSRHQTSVKTFIEDPITGPGLLDSDLWASSPCQGHQELSQDPGPQRHEHLCAGKALLDLKIPVLCLVRAVQGPVVGGGQKLPQE